MLENTKKEIEREQHHEKSAPIRLNHDSPNRLFFLIHGYTGSPTDFNGLSQYLHEQNEADVHVMLLPGHGTEIKALDRLSFEDFFVAVVQEFEALSKQYDEVIVGGVSFGAQLALILAARYPVAGVFTVCLPYGLRFPFNLPMIWLLGYFKKYWAKAFSEEEIELRKDAFYYDRMHARGLSVVKRANKVLRQSLKNITCPVLSVYTIYDPIGSHKAFDKIEKEIVAPYKKETFTERNHNIFYSAKKDQIYETISDFFK